MQALRSILAQAQQDGVAIGHFNVADWVLLKAVFDAAQEVNTPIVVGVSDTERDFLGVRQIAAVVRSLREEFEFPIFLNADHTHSLTKAKEAARAGFDAVVFDASALPLEDNVRQTRDAVEAVKSINPEILVEGELEDYGIGSEIHDEPPDPSQGMTTPEEARQFVESTGIDILAPGVGNIHGLLRDVVCRQRPCRLDLGRIQRIKAAAQVPLTLHGGSGIPDEDFRKAIAAGICIVHIDTELRVAWRRGLEQGLAKQPNEILPQKILPCVVNMVKQATLSRLMLFSSIAVAA